jgi:transposase
VEKGGLASSLDAVGLTRTSRIGFGDELRLGLRGTTRRVWGRRGTKVRQRLLDGLVWDNAPSHRDADITDLDLALVGLPPYSPELNPAERLFEEIRRRVEGRVYATLDAKVAEVQTFLEELDADPARVRSLCGWDWINAAIATLPEPLENAA